MTRMSTLLACEISAIVRIIIITEGFLMAEELNMHFSSVFTREDTSSLPVPETKFNGSEVKGRGS